MSRHDDHNQFRSSDFNGDRHKTRPRTPADPRVGVTASSGEGQRACARGQWCASVKAVEQPDGTTARIPGFTYQVFCQACSDLVVAALTEMPGVYVRIEQEYGSPVRRGDTPVRSPFGPSIPIRLDIDALQREAPPVIGGWAARVRAVPGLQLSAAQHPPDTPEGFAEACKVLRLYPEPLFALQPYRMTRTYRLPLNEDLEALVGDLEILHGGDDFVTVQVLCDGATAGNEILGLRRRATAVLGEMRSKPVELMGVPCRADGCGRLSLVRAEPPSDPEDPGDYSICLRCRARMGEEDYREWVALCAAYERNRRKVPVTLENLPGVA
jgi:hypothetical protein